MNTVARLRLLSAIGLAAVLAACGGGGGGGSSSPSGTLNVSMTDAPSCGYDHVNVTVAKVRVHQSAAAGDTDSGWQEIVLNPPRKIDLVALTNGVLTNLGQTALTAGHYTQMRLVLATNGGTTPTANSVVPKGAAAEIALDTPSAMQSGIKLIHEFDVAANELVDLVLDFDACQSVVAKGNSGFLLKPVISVIPKTVSGAIAGFVTPGLSNATVSAQANGVVVKSTVADATGAFTLSPLSPSAAYVVAITADGRGSIAISDVPVSAGANTAISTIVAPFALAASSANTASGTVIPVAAQGVVRATQTFAAPGPKVQIAFKNTDSVTGAYSLSLPTGASMLGKFGTGVLPIALTADATTAGKYTLEASASGYATQTAGIDVSAAAVTKNFVLTP